MKRTFMKLALTAWAILALCLSPALGETLVTYRVDLNNTFPAQMEAAQALRQTWPQLQFRQSDQHCDTGTDLVGALVTRAFEPDVFYLYTTEYDVHQLYRKGYVAELTGSEVLMDYVGSMHPAIRAQAMWDGKLYAVPEGVAFSCLQLGEGWAEAGYTAADVPDTFPAFLDFIQRWCDRIAEEPVDSAEPIALFGCFDSEFYGPASYTELLTGLLLDNWMMQQQYAGAPLRFDDPALVALLERVRTLGARLYQLSAAPEGDRMTVGLVEEKDVFFAGSGGQTETVYLRITAEQPRLIQGRLQLWMVNRNTQLEAPAIALLEELARRPWDSTIPAYLLTDAEAVENPDYEEQLTQRRQQLAEAEQKLAGKRLSGEERAKWEDRRDRLSAIVDRMNAGEGRYLFSPEELAAYQRAIAGGYFPPPTVFTPGASDDYALLEKLEKQFAAGVLSPQRLVKELDRVATMIQQEE